MRNKVILLALLFCANFSFAQMLSNRSAQIKAPAKCATAQSFKSSVFTKDVVVIHSCDFSAENVGYSTGVITEGLESHGEPFSYATWHRWANVEQSTLTSSASVYSALASNYFGGIDNYLQYMLRYLDTATSSAENGYMMMSLYDQLTPNSGNFNAYIQFDSIDASTAGSVDFQFFQYYRQYYDHCYLDFSTDGTSWYEMEINVTGIDIEVSGSLWGMYSYTLPLSAAGANNLSVRLRYKSLDSNRGAYGYFWIVDDVQFIAGPADRLTQYPQEYVEGNYGQIPQNMNIFPAWYAKVKNSGVATVSDVTATLYHLNSSQDTATQIASFNNSDIPVSAYKGVVCDAAGWLIVDSLYYRGWYGYTDHSTPNGTGMSLPTQTAGDNYIYATLGNSVVNLTYDTMYYHVNSADSNGNYTWAHDNGVLTYDPYNYWMYGFVNYGGNWYVSEAPDEVSFYSPGYTVTSRYTTADAIPSNWVIKGVELVASPVEGYQELGAQISAVLFKDQYSNAAIDFIELASGANVKAVTASDINDSNIISRYRNGYLTSGYNTIYIPFLNQPQLEPYTSYRIGYKLKSESFFALAHEAMGSYRIASPTRPDAYDTILYFKDNESTAKYAHYFKPNAYQTFVKDPIQPNIPDMFAQNIEMNPMIRMIVGPRTETEHVNIHVACSGNEDYDVIYNGQNVCGTTITPAMGASITLSAHSSEPLILTIDGHEIQSISHTDSGDSNYVIEHNAFSGRNTYLYTFEHLDQDHDIHFAFQTVGLDPVAANVRMNLQPNPATSQVNLNIAGVSGMVNCTLVDMSGRIVFNQNINAEVVHVINLSSLAKGAYFVRITNEKFCKVEKLIVR